MLLPYCHNLLSVINMLVLLVLLLHTKQECNSSFCSKNNCLTSTSLRITSLYLAYKVSKRFVELLLLGY